MGWYFYLRIIFSNENQLHEITYMSRVWHPTAPDGNRLAHLPRKLDRTSWKQADVVAGLEKKLDWEALA
jgi:hypothetical protein